MKASSIALMLLMHGITSFGLDVPYLSGHINDYGHMLTQQTIGTLEQELTEFESQTSHQIVILTLESLEGQPLEPFATEVFNTWELGHESNDNGVLLLIALQDRKIRIEVGIGLEGILTDAKTNQIIRQILAPHLRNSDYDAAITESIHAIQNIIQGEVMTPIPTQNSYHQLTIKIIFYTLLVLALLLVIWGILYWRRNRSRKSSKGKPMIKLTEDEEDAHLSKAQQLEEDLHAIDYDVWITADKKEVRIIPYKNWFSRYSTCPKCLTKAYSLDGKTILQEATYSRRGEGIKNYSCKHCQHTHQTSYSIPRKVRTTSTGTFSSGGWSSLGGSSWSGGSSFSGGGGSSWGGGSSGSW